MCVDCSQTTNTSGCYDDCGCLNPNTFKCTTYTGDELVNIDVENGDTGDEILSSLDTKIGEVLNNKGKSLVDEDDTCPQLLVDKLVAGTNVSLQVVGSGCTRKIRIDSTTGGVPVDVSVKISDNDTTSGNLYSKITTGDAISKNIINPSGNEKLKLDIVYSELLSGDVGNMLTLGEDGKLKTSYTSPDGSETKIVEGTGVNVSGTGTVSDPYVLSTNPSIQVARNCFDGTWRDITLVSISNSNITGISGTPKYRYRYDGTIEFKGSMTFTVAFGNYASSNRKYTITIGNIPVSCVTLSEQAGTVDMKGINYIDTPQASSDQIVQQYGYIIRKSAQNIIVEFQSSFTNTTSKTIVVNFDGAVHHPSL
jgi:hypothetical protein